MKDDDEEIGYRNQKYSGKATDAEFHVVNQTEEDVKSIRNLPATMDTVTFYRHPKAPAAPFYLDAIKDEIALDIELGLKNQFSIDQKKILKRDIDELTKSNNYYQVTSKLLGRMFKIGSLRSGCFFYNIKNGIVKTLIGIKVPLITIIIMMIILKGLFIAAPITSHSNSAYYTIAQIFCPIGIISLVIGLIVFILSFTSQKVGRIKFRFQFIDVKLKIENIKETMVTIPRMAKLKIKEAKDSGIFEEFTIAYPYFSVNREEYTPYRKVDPIILGITKDNREFMICWWDLAKDIDKVQTHINMFKKFKIS
jgi:hypothetical protein